jgi:hypothetical protein
MSNAVGRGKECCRAVERGINSLEVRGIIRSVSETFESQEKSVFFIFPDDPKL